GDDLIKILTINRLGSGDDSKIAIAELRNDFRDLKRALDKPATAPAPSPAPAEIPPYITKLIEKVIESYGVPPRDDAGGLKFNTLADLKNATQFFTSSGGKNLIDCEFAKIQSEGEARKLESTSKLESARVIAGAIKDGFKGAGFEVGRVISAGPYPSPAPGNPTEPIEIVATPSAGSPDLETLACPSCGATIPHIIGQARAVCPGCQNILTILPQIEHPEKSPSPDLPDSKKREVEQTRGLLQSGSAESG
ncbi:unnamed protein product, partial [marine sediment metagenome]